MYLHLNEDVRKPFVLFVDYGFRCATALIAYDRLRLVLSSNSIPFDHSTVLTMTKLEMQSQ
jgi:hypothetical protein